MDVDKIELSRAQYATAKYVPYGHVIQAPVGAGKSRTGIAHFFMACGGDTDPYTPMVDPKDLYIITTAHKRDLHEWEDELRLFGMSEDPKLNEYSNKIVVDSWNNIEKYVGITGASFIFDEQRVVGKGAWSKAFIKIAKANDWIMLTATPGDTWEDYIPLFIACGYYKNRSEFMRKHAVMSPYTKYPKVERWVGQAELEKHRHWIVYEMNGYQIHNAHDTDVLCAYDRETYHKVRFEHWNPYTDKPIETPGELFYTLRRVVNSDPSRMAKLINIVNEHERVIVFYNYEYERKMLEDNLMPDVCPLEWNGHKHENIPDCMDRWVYLVQYAAGAEGWNCTLTNTMCFYSMSYSYKTMTQAKGRIDRANTPYSDLYYYHLKSHAPIDASISRALLSKKDFNEKKYWVQVGF